MSKETPDLSLATVSSSGKTAEHEKHRDSAAQVMKLARQAVVKTQIQYLRIKRMGKSLRAREAGLLEEELRWTRRVRAIGSNDEQGALDSLASRVRCRVRLTNVRERLLIHDALESELHSRWKEAEVWMEKLVEGHEEPINQAEALEALMAMTERTDSGKPGQVLELDNYCIGLPQADLAAETIELASD